MTRFGEAVLPHLLVDYPFTSMGCCPDNVDLEAQARLNVTV